MSGGSFDYYFRMDLPEKLERFGTLADLERELRDLGRGVTGGGASSYGAQLPFQTVAPMNVGFALARIQRIRACAQMMNEDFAALHDVFHAVEWWRSCDWGVEDVRKALENMNAKEIGK